MNDLISHRAEFEAEVAGIKKLKGLFKEYLGFGYYPFVLEGVYLSTIPPGELNRNSISKNIGLDNKTVQHYLEILELTGLVSLLPVKKIYLDNPDLYVSISQEIGFVAQVGTIREIFFINMMKTAGHTIHASRIGDFESEGYFFEIGGKNKDKKQLRESPVTGYLVKDDILYGTKNEIPLHLFGFLY